MGGGGGQCVRSRVQGCGHRRSSSAAPTPAPKAASKRGHSATGHSRPSAARSASGSSPPPPSPPPPSPPPLAPPPLAPPAARVAGSRGDSVSRGGASARSQAASAALTPGSAAALRALRIATSLQLARRRARGDGGTPASRRRRSRRPWQRETPSSCAEIAARACWSRPRARTCRSSSTSSGAPQAACKGACGCVRVCAGVCGCVRGREGV